MTQKLKLEYFAWEELKTGNELVINEFGYARRADWAKDQYPDDYIGRALKDTQPREVVLVIYP